MSGDYDGLGRRIFDFSRDNREPVQPKRRGGGHYAPTPTAESKQSSADATRRASKAKGGRYGEPIEIDWDAAIARFHRILAEVYGDDD